MFFIFGSPRSGTTLLAQCLNAHSEIVVPHETDFIIPMAFIFDRVYNEKIGRELIYKMIVNAASFSSNIGEYINAEAVHDIVQSSEYGPSYILNALYAKIAEAAGAKLAGDKSPNDLNFSRILVKTSTLSQNIKTIHIVRDIRDLMISVNKTGWVTDLDSYFPRFWCSNNLYLNAIYKHSIHNYALVRYEDLVTNPQKEVTRLSNFLGVEFEQGMLLPKNRHQRYQGHEVHSNLYNSITDASVGKHKTILDPLILNNYETQAREALLAFGYNIDSSC